MKTSSTEVNFENMNFIKNLWIETEELTAGEELLTKSLEISEKISDERYVQLFIIFW